MAIADVARIDNGPDTRTVVRNLDGGRVELRHDQWAEGLGWYGTQRIVVEAEALPALRRALLAAEGLGRSVRSGRSSEEGGVIALDDWR